MRSTLDTAKDKLAEDQFKTLFDNPRIGSHNSKDVIEWTYHNPNGSDETLWVPLKTKDNQPLPTSKIKNNIHNKCSDLKKQQLAAPHSTTSQIFHGRSQPTCQRGASSELTTIARSSGAKEEVTEHYAPDGTYTRHMTREVESHEETTTLKNQVTELEQKLTRLEDGHLDDMCEMYESQQNERRSWENDRDSWNEEKTSYDDRIAKLNGFNEELEEELASHENKFAKLREELDAKEKECKSLRAKQTPFVTEIPPVDKSTSPSDESLESPLQMGKRLRVPGANGSNTRQRSDGQFDGSDGQLIDPPDRTPSHTWTSKKLLGYMRDCPMGSEEGFPKMLEILDEYVGLHKTSLYCKFAHADGSAVDLWMPQAIVYFKAEYYTLWQEFERKKEAIDTSWDV